MLPDLSCLESQANRGIYICHAGVPKIFSDESIRNITTVLEVMKGHYNFGSMCMPKDDFQGHKETTTTPNLYFDEHPFESATPLDVSIVFFDFGQNTVENTKNYVRHTLNPGFQAYRGTKLVDNEGQPCKNRLSLYFNVSNTTPGLSIISDLPRNLNLWFTKYMIDPVANAVNADMLQYMTVAASLSHELTVPKIKEAIVQTRSVLDFMFYMLMLYTVDVDLSTIGVIDSDASMNTLWAALAKFDVKYNNRYHKVVENLHEVRLRNILHGNDIVVIEDSSGTSIISIGTIMAILALVLFVLACVYYCYANKKGCWKPRKKSHGPAPDYINESTDESEYVVCYGTVPSCSPECQGDCHRAEHHKRH